eukprot:465678-Pleurochrysis_carterae.AAC.1
MATARRRPRAPARTSRQKEREAGATRARICASVRACAAACVRARVCACARAPGSLPAPSLASSDGTRRRAA